MAKVDEIAADNIAIAALYLDCRAAQRAERLRLGLWAHEGPTATGLLTSMWANFRAAVARLRR